MRTWHVPHERVMLDCGGMDASKTQQEFKDECDINMIIDKFGPDLSSGANRQPTFGDFTAVDDFQSAMELVADAQYQFDTLPAALRKRFDNDPNAFIEWFDQASPDELKEAGLINEPLVVAPAPAEPGATPAPVPPEPTPPQEA